MKTVIYCFSGTGNNLMIAHRLAEKLGDTDVLPMSVLKEHKTIPSEYQWVGFATPAYYSHVPPLVKEAMTDLKFSGHQKIFTIVGCGINRGMAHHDLRACIESAHKKVQLEYMISMPGSYILSYNGGPDWCTEIMTKLAYKKIAQIAKDITQDHHRNLSKPGIFYKEANEPRLQEQIAAYPEICEQYTVSSECTKCQTCIAVCPAHNISLKDGQIAFGKDCQQCMACIQWCPKKAIDYKGIASKRKHYHHPHVTVKEMKTFQKQH